MRSLTRSRKSKGCTILCNNSSQRRSSARRSGSCIRCLSGYCCVLSSGGSPSSLRCSMCSTHRTQGQWLLRSVLCTTNRPSRCAKPSSEWGPMLPTGTSLTSVGQRWSTKKTSLDLPNRCTTRILQVWTQATTLTKHSLVCLTSQSTTFSRLSQSNSTWFSYLFKVQAKGKQEHTYSRVHLATAVQSPSNTLVKMMHSTMPWSTTWVCWQTTCKV